MTQRNTSQLDRESIDNLVDSWALHLRASNLADTTIYNYTLAVKQFAEWMDTRNIEHVTTTSVRGFMRVYLDGYSPATARQKYINLKIFFDWLVTEEELDETPMKGVTPPKQIEVEVPLLKPGEVERLLRSCDTTPVGRRDQAIITLFADTGIRLAELVNLKRTDVDLRFRTITVLAKGRKLRTIPFSPRSGKALDRVLRSHNEEMVWQGQRGHLTVSGVSQLLARKGKEVLGYRIHAHQFRHTFAHTWMSEGGSETDLERYAGWKSPQMVRRYGSSAADERAYDSYRRMKG